MLTEKPWKLEAMLRLALSILICICALSMLSSIFYDGRPASKPGFRSAALGAVALGLFVAALFQLAKAWSIEHFTGRVLVLLFCIYAGLALGEFARKGTTASDSAQPPPAFAMLALECATLFFIRRFVREHGLGWREAFGFCFDWRRAALVGVVAAVIFLPIGRGLQEGSIALMERVRLQPEEQPAVRALRTSVSLIDRVCLGVIAVVLAPLAEEMMFRGILYPGIKRAGWPRLALWGSSLVFAAMHANMATFAPLLVLALVLALLYERTNNLLAPITTHSLFNALNFAWFYYQEHARRLP